MQAPQWDMHRCSWRKTGGRSHGPLDYVTLIGDFWRLQRLMVIPFLLGIAINSCNPVDCSQPGFSVYGILQASILEWVAMPSSRGIFPTQGWNPGLLHCRWILYQLSHLSSPNVFFSNGFQYLQLELQSFMCLEMYFYLIIISEFQNIKNKKKDTTHWVTIYALKRENRSVSLVTYFKGKWCNQFQNWCLSKHW